jgi:cellulose synthase/poly-beta-1,6-N-acetylglucosamine synthase-like glycosyltransferase
MNDVLKSPEISIVVPLYNEEKDIRLMYDRLVSSILKITSNFEIIYVNDGSKDNSFLKSINLNDYEKVFLFQVFENTVDPKQSVFNYLNDELQLTKSIKSFREIKLIEFSTQSDSYTSSNSLKNGNKLQLNFYKQKIVSYVNWFSHIKKKAKSQNMSLDSTLMNACG